MGSIIILFTTFFFINSSFAVNESVQERCVPYEKGEPHLTQKDFHWGYGREEMAQHFAELYQSNKRLAHRAYWDDQAQQIIFTMELFVKTENGYEYQTRKIVIPPIFMASVTTHIEQALEKGYAEYIFFPDMGHSHFFIPWETYQQKIEPIPPQERDRTYQTLLELPDLKILYHTAEQLKMTERTEKGPRVLPDPLLAWRYSTRNLVGGLGEHSSVFPYFAWDNKGYNTLRTFPDHRYYGGGFNISANQSGCFSFKYRGETYYYDLSFEDLPLGE